MDPRQTFIDAQEKLGANMDEARQQVAIIAAANARIAELVDNSRIQVDRMGKNSLNDRIVMTEVAAALNMSPRGADLLVYRSYVLVHDLPATLQALREGTISWAHAGVIINEAVPVPADDRALFEQKLLDIAASTSPSQLGRRGRTLRERLHPETMTERRTEAVKERRVWVEPLQDGMAEFGAVLTVEDATAIFNRVTTIAKGLQTPEDDRTLSQTRADVTADLLINGGLEAAIGLGAGIVAEVSVNVPVFTMMGTSDQPADLEGIIPIPAEVARRLAATAPSFMRILTHPETGAVLSFGRTKYRPPKDLRNFIRMRDGSSRSPWNSPGYARFGDIDHTIPYDSGGTTDPGNLAVLSKADHTIKHHSLWDVKNLGDGVLEWVSPGRRTYIERPQRDMPWAPDWPAWITDSKTK
jgi:truncated hemoglobin YjbI